MIRRLVVDPQAFVEDVINFGRIKTSILMVAVVGLAFILQGVAVWVALGDESGIVSYAAMVFAAYRFLEPVFLWVVLSILFSIAAGVLGGQMRFGKVLKSSAYGFLPMIGTGVSWAAGYYLALEDERLPNPDDISTGFFGEEYEALIAYLEQGYGEPVFVGGLVVGFVFLVWSGHLWRIAVHKSTGLGKTRASLVVGASILLYIVYTFNQLYG